MGGQLATGRPTRDDPSMDPRVANSRPLPTCVAPAPERRLKAPFFVRLARRARTVPLELEGSSLDPISHASHELWDGDDLLLAAFTAYPHRYRSRLCLAFPDHGHVGNLLCLRLTNPIIQRIVRVQVAAYSDLPELRHD